MANHRHTGPADGGNILASSTETITGTEGAKAVTPKGNAAAIIASVPGHYSRDQRWQAQPVSVAADRYTLLSPNRMAVDVNGTLSLLMPDPGGLAVMEILARELPDIRVVVVTADIQETTRVRCLELGAVAFLNKPVDPSALAQALRALL